MSNATKSNADGKPPPAEKNKPAPNAKDKRSRLGHKEWGVETKAKACAMLLAGESVTTVCANLGVPERTVYDWANGLGGIDALRSGRLDDLLYSCLSENLTTLAAQSRFARDEQWLKKQKANAVAILFGVISDKTIHILSAIERAKAIDTAPAG